MRRGLHGKSTERVQFAVRSPAMDGTRGPIAHPAARVGRRQLLVVAGIGAAAPILAPASGGEAQVPGLAACIVKDGAVSWSHGYGHANIAHERVATPGTIFMLASISNADVLPPA